MVAVSSKTWLDCSWISKLRFSSSSPRVTDGEAYISAMGQPSRDQASILNDLFPSTAQLTHLFVARRSIGPLTSVPTQEDLTPAEIEFISKCDRRRELLRSHGDDDKQVA